MATNHEMVIAFTNAAQYSKHNQRELLTLAACCESVGHTDSMNKADKIAEGYANAARLAEEIAQTYATKPVDGVVDNVDSNYQFAAYADAVIAAVQVE